MSVAPPDQVCDLKIESLSSYVVRIPRDFEQAVGGAGSPAALNGNARRYHFPKSYSTIYSKDIECLLVKIEAGGYVGWGEAQAPIAPEICHAILEHLLGPLLIGEAAPAPVATYSRLYNAMRVRGHSGSFYLDALAAIDVALWDLLGKISGKSVVDLLGGSVRDSVPSYISGLLGNDDQSRLDHAVKRIQQGAKAFKVYWTDCFDQGLALVERMRSQLPESVDIYVDTLWRMKPHEAVRYSRLLSDLRVGWLEAPFMPEDIAAHSWLCERSQTPIAVGESYRSSWDFDRLVQERASNILQPDLGRCGITTTRRVAELCGLHNLGFAPHVSISLGPQLAAAIHVAAIAPTLVRAECNPDILTVARRFSDIATQQEFSEFQIPQEPGLGIEVSEAALRPYITATTKVA